MAKIVCVLYPDPVESYPSSYPRASVPKIDRYPSGQTTPTPKAIDFTPGELLRQNQLAPDPQELIANGNGQQLGLFERDRE